MIQEICVLIFGAQSGTLHAIDFALGSHYAFPVSQPQTFSERMELSVPPVQRLLSSDVSTLSQTIFDENLPDDDDGEQIQILIDDLDGVDGVRNNPVWCTYANAARYSVSIDV